MWNQTYFILFTHIHYKVSIPVRTAIEASTLCDPIYKDIRSSRNENNVQTKGEIWYTVYLDFTKPWTIEFRQQANVGDLPFQTNQPINQESESLLPQEKKVFKFSILFASTMITHMSRERLVWFLEFDYWCSTCKWKHWAWIFCEQVAPLLVRTDHIFYSCIDNSGGQHRAFNIMIHSGLFHPCFETTLCY